jgi:uncharacterized protein YeaC (DUF1315 family)
LFVLQERASKQLPGAGQHFSFGALKPWEDVLQFLDEKKSKCMQVVVLAQHSGDKQHQAAVAQQLSATCKQLQKSS